MRIVVLVAALALAALPASAHPALQKLFGCSSRVCTITSNGGGALAEFEAARAEAESDGVQIRIVGFCGSACESVIARSPNACAGPRARFVAHGIRSQLARNVIAGLPTFTGDEHEGDRQDVVRAGQLDELAAVSGLDVGRVDHRQPPGSQPLARDVGQHVERVARGGLVVLVIGHQAAAEVAGDDLEPAEVLRRERGLAGPGHADQHDQG